MVESDDDGVDISGSGGGRRVPDSYADFTKRLAAIDERFEYAKESVLELQDILAKLMAEAPPGDCDHRPGYLHWVGNDLGGGRALIWCRCGALAIAEAGRPAARLPVGEPVLLQPDGRLKPMDLTWTLPGTLPSAREERRTIMGMATSPEGEKALREALEAGSVAHTHALIEASSLGTPEAKALADQTPPEIAQRIVARADKLLALKRKGTRILIDGVFGTLLDQPDAVTVQIRLDDGSELTTEAALVEPVPPCIICGETNTHWAADCGHDHTPPATLERAGGPWVATVEWPDPTQEMIKADPVFEAIWQAIRTWDISVPGAYEGYMGATGNHARKIRDALQPLLDGVAKELGNAETALQDLRMKAYGLEVDLKDAKDDLTVAHAHCRLCGARDGLVDTGLENLDGEPQWVCLNPKLCEARRERRDAPADQVSTEELKEHWDGCAGAEGTINDLRAQVEFLSKAVKVPNEIVICAALQLPDGRVIRCHRHHHGIPIALQMLDLSPDGDEQKKERVHQGFVTSTGRYVDRLEGLALQRAAGIESVAKGGYRPPELFSEDLY